MVKTGKELNKNILVRKNIAELASTHKTLTFGISREILENSFP